MKIFTRFYSLLLIILIGISFTTKTFAQCAGGNNNGTVAFACNSELIQNPQNQGDYRQFSVITNISYNFNTTGTTYDTRIYGNVTGVGGANQFDQDADNVVGNNESIDWTATYTGTLGVGVHYFSCATWNGLSAILRYKQNTTVSNTTDNSSLCNGQNRVLTASLGGLHNNPTVSWTVAAGGGSISSGTYISGTYSGGVTVRATVGVCISDVNFLVLPPLTATLSGGSTNICYNTAPSQFTATGSGGTGSYT